MVTEQREHPREGVFASEAYVDVLQSLGRRASEQGARLVDAARRRPDVVAVAVAAAAGALVGLLVASALPRPRPRPLRVVPTIRPPTVEPIRRARAVAGLAPVLVAVLRNPLVRDVLLRALARSLARRR
ncbi:MAG TPA: hypothetical protein VIN09_11585 [Chloroflexota bacterium]